MITLGCSKNTVDTEHLLASLPADDFVIVEDDSPVDCLLINTCGFIGDAKEESISVILESVERKKVSILSKEHEKIQNYIVKELRRGATIYPAYGGLDHAEHVEVVTILEKNEYGKLLSFIHETDEHAFVTVSTVNEVVGAWNTVKSR